MNTEPTKTQHPLWLFSQYLAKQEEKNAKQKLQISDLTRKILTDMTASKYFDLLMLKPFFEHIECDVEKEKCLKFAFFPSDYSAKEYTSAEFKALEKDSWLGVEKRYRRSCSNHRPIMKYNKRLNVISITIPVVLFQPKRIVSQETRDKISKAIRARKLASEATTKT